MFLHCYKFPLQLEGRIIYPPVAVAISQVPTRAHISCAPTGENRAICRLLHHGQDVADLDDAVVHIVQLDLLPGVLADHNLVAGLDSHGMLLGAGTHSHDVADQGLLLGRS